MTEEEMKDLRPGDVVRHKWSTYDSAVVENHGWIVTAVRYSDITNPEDWEVVSRYAGAARGEREKG